MPLVATRWSVPPATARTRLGIRPKSFMEFEIGERDAPKVCQLVPFSASQLGDSRWRCVRTGVWSAS
jgi:hypothetical protein